MNRLISLAPIALLAACSQETARNDAAQNDMQETEPPILTDAAEPVPATGPAPVVETGNIPAAFHGNWSAKAADCGKGGDVTRLAIVADALRFYESSASVTAVSGTGREISVTARYTGEGETWDAARSFTLSADGKALTSDGMTRVRCP